MHSEGDADHLRSWAAPWPLGGSPGKPCAEDTLPSLILGLGEGQRMGLPPAALSREITEQLDGL